MHKIAFAIIAASGFVANADIVRVDEFNSLEFEGFNNLNMKDHEKNPVSIFGGMGEVFNTKHKGWLQASSRWSYHAGKDRGYIGAYEGSKMLGNTSGAIEYRFSSGQRSFGGFFASAAKEADGSVQFYNDEVLVGEDVLKAAVGKWSWNGWTAETEFNRVLVDSNHGKHGGYIMHDAVRVLATDVPTQGSLAILGMGIFVAGRRRR